MVEPTASEIKLLNDRVLILPDEPPEFLNGFAMPDMVKETPTRGTIIAVGPGKPMMKLNEANEPVYGRYPPVVKQGDKVYYGRYCGGEVVIDRVVYKIMTEGEVQFVVD